MHTYRKASVLIVCAVVGGLLVCLLIGGPSSAHVEIGSPSEAAHLSAHVEIVSPALHHHYSSYEQRTRCWNKVKDGNHGDDKSNGKESTTVIRHPPCARLKTLDEILDLAVFPCNFVHDGFYLEQGNFVLEEVYKTLIQMIDDTTTTKGDKTDASRIVPIFAEIGGHDGITKSISLKSSRCLHTNTLLIEASPTNYAVLKNSRAYDTTVNGALCDGDFVEITDNPVNSGQTRLVKEGHAGKATVTARVPCTTLDNEIEAMRQTLPGNGTGYEMKLIFLVLDVEGNEELAIKGIQKYTPSKAMVEVKSGNRGAVEEWATKSGLVGNICGKHGADVCYNFNSMNAAYPKNVFYGARSYHPPDNFRTSKVSSAYMHYGK